MRKGSKGKGCNSASHRHFKDRAKNRVDDLQMIFSDLQSARKESRTVDAAVLEEQVYQMLREWKSELNEPSPASSLQNDSLATFSSDIYRLLSLCEEEDDATSPLELPAPKSEPKSEPDVQKFQAGGPVVMPEGNDMKYEPDEKILSSEEHKDPSLGLHSLPSVNLDMTNQLAYNQFNLPLGLENAYFSGFPGFGVDTLDATQHISGLLPNISPPPSAFLGPKCALWDCPRPAQGSGWWQDYCSNFHATLALNEGPPGMTPVLRPGGIGLKDGLLFAALSGKAEGKDVGIPECAGAATAKSPWNAPELFDLSVLDGETIREWLFFDKPRRAFESGTRKQRSLPDYNGRGWHESRKQVMNEFHGLKRSYYMDPQPLNTYEWHLYEYEINNYDACALYRLELKLVIDGGKKTSRGKATHDTVSELQKQMGRLTAEFPLEAKRPSRGRSKGNNIKESIIQSEYSAPNKVTSTNTSGEAFYHGTNEVPYGYLVKNLSAYYPDNNK